MTWDLLVTKATVHGTEDTPPEYVTHAAQRLADSFRAVAAAAQAANPGICIDMTGTVRSEADVRAALGLPPARTAAQRLRDEMNARLATHDMTFGQMQKTATAAQADAAQARAELEDARNALRLARGAMASGPPNLCGGPYGHLVRYIVEVETVDDLFVGFLAAADPTGVWIGDEDGDFIPARDIRAVTPHNRADV